ncbi:type IV secretion system DNA-binding domain-containing protein, partial [Escherichia coli]
MDQTDSGERQNQSHYGLNYIEKLRTFLRNSPAANLVEEKIEKTAISIRAVLTNYVKAIRYLQGIEHNGESFTI